MPRFEVTSVITVAFDAEDAAEARYLVESGETPRDHILLAAAVSTVDRVVEEI